jgi:hypothetical protein
MKIRKIESAKNATVQAGTLVYLAKDEVITCGGGCEVTVFGHIHASGPMLTAGNRYRFLTEVSFYPNAKAPVGAGVYFHAKPSKVETGHDPHVPLTEPVLAYDPDEKRFWEWARKAGLVAEIPLEMQDDEDDDDDYDDDEGIPLDSDSLVPTSVPNVAADEPSEEPERQETDADPAAQPAADTADDDTETNSPT